MENYKNICDALKNAIPRGWEWDSRFGTALVCMKEEDSQEIRANLSEIFENEYGSASIRKASKQEKLLAKKLSGLQKEQLLFTSNTEKDTLFGAWWPWRDKSNVSLRVGLYTTEADEAFYEKATEHLTGWFGLK